MIDVQHLTKTYQRTVAVSDVSFTVQEGQTLVLLGTSGSGKTTTLRMLNRLTEPTSGSIFINGQNILLQPPETLRRSIGYVLQGYGLFPHYTVAENVALVPTLLKWPAQAIQKRVDELLLKLQLPPEHFRSAYPASLSGGQKQRVGLARALAASPPILLMDEPFGALDPLTRAGIRQEFKELDELKKTTTILVTHDVQEAFALGDVIGLMDKGRLVQIGTPAQLLFSPANTFARQFFDQQRLQLEWQALKLKDIWHHLPAATVPRNVQLSSGQTVWEALELAANCPSPITAFDDETTTHRQVSPSNLHEAIYTHKQRS